MLLLAFIAAHLPLGLILKKVPMASTVHALGVFVVGAIVAARCRTPIAIAYLAAYTAGIEVIWRMTKSKTFTEWGKLTISVFVIIGIIRFARLKRAWLPVIYYVLLLPSAVMIYFMLEWDEFKEAMTTTMSGPFAVMVCLIYFSGLKINAAQHLRLMLATLMPILAVSAIVAFTTVTAQDLDFSANVRNLKDATMSGGFGPNQVSSTLGLGVFAAFMIVMHELTTPKFKLAFFVIMLGLATQAALTFSRTGLYLAAGSIVVACFFYLGDSKVRGKIIGFGLALVVAVAIVLPLLNSFTGGALLERFSRIDTTGRDNILICDALAFMRNPLLGLGVDQGAVFRSQYMGVLMESHLEWSRMLAEHGLFGLASLLVLLWMGWRGFATARTPRERAAAGSILVFTMLYTSSSGMRLAIPAVTFAIACAIWQFAPRRQHKRPPVHFYSPYSAPPELVPAKPVLPASKF